jgi:hypothetical protein
VQRDMCDIIHRNVSNNNMRLVVYKSTREFHMKLKIVLRCVCAFLFFMHLQGYAMEREYVQEVKVKEDGYVRYLFKLSKANQIDLIDSAIDLIIHRIPLDQFSNDYTSVTMTMSPDQTQLWVDNHRGNDRMIINIARGIVGKVELSPLASLASKITENK